MATINQVQKTDYQAIKIDYTSKDYVAILDDLINSIPGITQKWKSTDENDPGIILVKLMSILGDMLFYTQDMMALEIYPNSVTQRKNAASIYKLIGYKMRWYRSATLEANIVNTYSNGATMPRFCTFATENQETIYTTFDQYELPSNMTNNGLETLIELVQGIPVTPVRTSSSPYPESGKPWHSIYGFNYTKDDVINNRIYLKDNNIDESHIILIDDQNEQWELQDNIYLTTAVGRFFEFGVDVNDQAYIELIDYWTSFNVSKFKVFYIKSKGEEGQILANTLKTLTGNVWSRGGTASAPVTYNVSTFIHFTHYDSTLGYDPETPDEARKESPKFQNTLDTLITLADFERATLREPGVANVRATDLTNDPGMSVNYYIGDINKDTYINGDDVQLLENYLADPINNPLSSYQKKLADINQDGTVDIADLQCLNNYVQGNYEDSGQAGIKTIPEIELLEGFIVKLYILRTDEWAQVDDDTYTNMIKSDLQQYKILPLTIDVDLHSIKQYYWTITGTFMTTEPLSRDELQTIIVNINNALRYQYDISKINFNTIINYKDVIETILNVDNRILMVDLDPIKYYDNEGNEVTKQQLTGEYSYTVAKLTNPVPSDNLHYNFNLPEVPILPGSVMIRVNQGQYVLRDNNNGQIFNVDNILAKKGSIDYVTGEIDLQFNSEVIDDIIIDYVQNQTAVPVFKNLSTQTFFFDSSSLIKDDMQDLV